MYTICIVTSENMGEYAGIQKFVLNLTNFLTSKRHKVILISNKDSVSSVSVLVLESSKQLSSREFANHKLKKTNSFTNPIKTLLLSAFTTLALISTCKRHRTSVIHSQDIFFSGFAGVIIHKMFKIPLIVHAHGPSPYFAESTSEATKIHRILMRAMAKIVMHNSTLIIVTDNHTKQLLSPYSGKTLCKRIPTPINLTSLKKQTKSTATIKTSNEDLTLGFVGRLSPQKNLKTLLTAFALIPKSMKERLKLMIVGDGPERTSLMDESKRLGIHNQTTFAGAVSEERKNELFTRFDIFVLPSLYEGCPIALLEAMTYGKAIITSDIPSIGEIVKRNEEAFLINPHDVEKLKQAIIFLSKDPKLRSMLGDKASRRAAFYDSNHIFNKLLEIYWKLSQHILSD